MRCSLLKEIIRYEETPKVAASESERELKETSKQGTSIDEPVAPNHSAAETWGVFRSSFLISLLERLRLLVMGFLVKCPVSEVHKWLEYRAVSLSGNRSSSTVSLPMGVCPRRSLQEVVNISRLS